MQIKYSGKLLRYLKRSEWLILLRNVFLIWGSRKSWYECEILVSIVLHFCALHTIFSGFKVSITRPEILKSQLLKSNFLKKAARKLNMLVTLLKGQLLNLTSISKYLKPVNVRYFMLIRCHFTLQTALTSSQMHHHTALHSQLSLCSPTTYIPKILLSCGLVVHLSYLLVVIIYGPTILFY